MFDSQRIDKLTGTRPGPPGLKPIRSGKSCCTIVESLHPIARTSARWNFKGNFHGISYGTQWANGMNRLQSS